MGLFAGAVDNLLTAGLDNAVLPQYAVSLALCLNYTGGLDFTAGKNRLFLRYSRGGWDSNVWSWNIIRWCNRIRGSRCYRRNIGSSQNNSVFLGRSPRGNTAVNRRRPHRNRVASRRSAASCLNRRGRRSIVSGENDTFLLYCAVASGCTISVGNSVRMGNAAGMDRAVGVGL